MKLISLGRVSRETKGTYINNLQFDGLKTTTGQRCSSIPQGVQQPTPELCVVAG